MNNKQWCKYDDRLTAECLKMPLWRYKLKFNIKPKLMRYKSLILFFIITIAIVIIDIVLCF